MKLTVNQTSARPRTSPPPRGPGVDPGIARSVRSARSVVRRSKRGRVQLGVALLGAMAWVVLVGCSRQDEGDRCATENANQDCESGLVCVDATNLRGGGDGVSRCCPPDGSPVGDGRCTRLAGGGSNTGGGNEAGQGGEASTSSGTTASSQTCDYNSDCPMGMVCGPQGSCQDECREDRDCPGSMTCAGGSCVSEGSAGGGS